LVILLRLAWTTRRAEIDPSSAAIPAGTYAIRRIRDDASLELFLDEQRDRWFTLRLLGIAVVDHESLVRQLRGMIGGHAVQLRFDRRRIDDDQTLMAYVFVDGKFVCSELVRLGLAREATHQADAGPIVRQLKKAQQEAQSQRLGIWGESALSAKHLGS
jgi:hypothetical protein